MVFEIALFGRSVLAMCLRRLGKGDEPDFEFVSEGEADVENLPFGFVMPDPNEDDYDDEEEWEGGDVIA